MIRLALILYLLIAPTLAGILVLVALAAPQLGLDNMKGVGILGIGGLVAGLPLSFIAAHIIGKPRKG
ncbi:MAG: CTP synthetase [Neomegalonema sp.]|nr:CTP synthetase [Neomegalonema sp.]